MTTNPDTCEDCNKPYDDHNGRCSASIRRGENEVLAREIVLKLSQYTNQGRQTALIVNELKREHRTLQQKMTAVMLQWFVDLASLPSGHYDARNQKSVEVAKAILPVLDAQNVVIKRHGKQTENEAHLPCI